MVKTASASTGYSRLIFSGLEGVLMRFLSALILANGLMLAGGAKANITINAVETGSDVVFSFTGSIDTTSLGTVTPSTGTFTDIDYQTIYNMQTGYDYYYAISSAPVGFAPTPTTASARTGDSVGVDYYGFVFLPASYASNTPISSTMTFANKSFSTLGLTVGNYVWTLTGGQTVTLTVGPTYTIGGTISGLTASGLVLTDTNAGSSTITANSTSFTLPTAVNSGTNYAVTVQTQATGQTCTVSNGTGTANANVTNVSVTCTTPAPPAPVPTLSEWAQMLLATLMVATMGWFWRKQQV